MKLSGIISYIICYTVSHILQFDPNYLKLKLGLRVHIFGEKWCTVSGGLHPHDPLLRCKLVASYALEYLVM